ncbi:MAG: hypothetical protein N3F11_05575 [Casimicrobiaceae bacterium]|nr:hypothetical protein [Casimicrobiaceae bacterium]
MRRLVAWLAAANLVAGAWWYLEFQMRAETAAQARFQPFNDEKVRLLTAQEVARLGPAKVAQLNHACAEWGPLNEAERVRALKLLEPLALGRTLSERKVEVVAEHWIVIPPKANRAQAERAMAELRALKVEDAVLLTEPGPWNLAISLGLFRDRARAEARLEEVRAKGVRTATYRQRAQSLPMTMLVVREPSQAVVAQLTSLSAQIPGSAVSTGGCPEIR